MGSIAPLLPIAIVAVNAAENNTAVSSPPSEPSKAQEEKANGRSLDLPLVDTPHMQSVVEESTERTGLVPLIKLLPTPEAVVQESPSEQTPIPVIEPVTSENVTTPSTATNVEAGLISTRTVPEIPASSSPGVVAEESTTDPEPTNLVTEEKMQTPSSVPEVKDVEKSTAKSSIIVPQSQAVDPELVTERKVAEPMATPAFPTTPRKKTPTTSSFKEMPDSPSFRTSSPSQSTDGSPSSSRVNSGRKKRTSIFGKIKHVLHLDKEKERK
jgi:hypothetical protein